jgi:hypothetical protein
MKITRRDFFGHSAAAVGVAAAGAALAGAAEQPRKLKSAADQVTLGRSGVKTSLLGMGTGSVGVKHSSNQVKLGEEGFKRLVRYAYDRGITYFDTADQYGSHIYLREALRGIPRDKLFLHGLRIHTEVATMVGGPLRPRETYHEQAEADQADEDHRHARRPQAHRHLLPALLHPRTAQG